MMDFSKKINKSNFCTQRLDRNDVFFVLQVAKVTKWVQILKQKVYKCNENILWTRYYTCMLRNKYSCFQGKALMQKISHAFLI